MEEETGTLPPKSAFSEWYNELLWRAEIMDVRYPVKGLYVWYPHGFAIRREVYRILREIMDREHREALFPLLIPASEFMKEAEHIKGFEDEVYWVTRGGKAELDIPLALRPTSETAIYPMYALWIRSHADLPLRIYQVVNSFRYETKHTRPLIRLREITSFKEAHTVHATWEEAEEQVRKAITFYREFYERLCVPVIVSRRPDWDKFPGADYTLAVDTIMPDGKTLQIGTAHHLGTHFSRTFQILFEDKNGEQKHAQQTCYGISERSIAALISLHGDDRGIILPPDVAPIQVIIVPVIVGKRKDEILAQAASLATELRGGAYRVQMDNRDLRPGAKYYYWEMRGVPLRLEIGPRDIDAGVVTAITRDGERSVLPRINLGEKVRDTLSGFEVRLREKARHRMEDGITKVTSLSEIPPALEKGIAIIPWCGERACADKLAQQSGGDVLGIITDTGKSVRKEGSCIICGEPAIPTLMGRAY
ncbi:MAG: proline--tRNA ligase [Methanomicrobiales archaeon]|nr:proline--tRNA ligase [Methanomicrobiales archaeon]